jgi:glucose dehydrogenase
MGIPGSAAAGRLAVRAGRRPGQAASRRPALAGVSLVIVAGLAVAGCGSSNGHSNVASCFAKHTTAGPGNSAPGGGPNPAVAAGWTLPGGNLANTRDVASPITSSNVTTLGVAWCVPVESTGKTHAAGIADGYATTPVVVNGVVYVQDQESDVMAIRLATGKVLWTHNYNSINGGPDGVNVVGGTVYAATDSAAVALSAATGQQLWSRTLIGNDLEGIDMAPGYNHGTVYVSTVPVNPNKGEYLGGAKATLWALNARTGAPEWSWDEVQNLWGNPGLNSGGGLWDPPSFDAAGNLYIGIANPGPIGQGGWPKGYPWATSRPGPDLYTDSVVKLSPAGKLLWYYQLTPHDLFDWDLQNSPVLTTAHGQPVVIDGGKAGILIELNAKTGKLLWKLPVGVHSGPANAGLLTEHATPASASSLLPATFELEPGVFGGVESQLATNGSTTFAAVNNLGVPMSVKGVTESGKAFAAAIPKATGEMVAVNQDTGKIEWDDKLPSTPYGAATVTNNVVFTTTYSGHLYAFNAATGAILLNTPLSAGSSAPVAVDGDYVIAGASVPLSGQALIIAYKLGAHGKLPHTVGR